jgi:hypothetical protein
LLMHKLHVCKLLSYFVLMMLNLIDLTLGYSYYVSLKIKEVLEFMICILKILLYLVNGCSSYLPQRELGSNYSAINI